MRLKRKLFWSTRRIGWVRRLAGTQNISERVSLTRAKTRHATTWMKIQLLSRRIRASLATIFQLSSWKKQRKTRPQTTRSEVRDTSTSESLRSTSTKSLNGRCSSSTWAFKSYQSIKWTSSTMRTGALRLLTLSTWMAKAGPGRLLRTAWQI